MTSMRGRALALVVFLGSSAGLTGCGVAPINEKLVEQQTTVEAVYFDERSPEDPRDDSITMLLDGDPTAREWSSAPSSYVLVDGARGNGGGTLYATVRARYTHTRLYLLVQWGDRTRDDRKDQLTYINADTLEQTGRFVHGPEPTEGECDHLLKHRDPRNWTRVNPVTRRVNDEDRVALAFLMDPSDAAVAAYQKDGCTAACHGTGSGDFGATQDKLDVWEWLAHRTNGFREGIYTLFPIEQENLRLPTGYMDDLVAGPDGLRRDAGKEMYFPNFPADAPPLGGNLPTKIHPLVTAPPDANRNNRINATVWLWDGDDQNFGPARFFADCDTLNPIRTSGVDPGAKKKWGKKLGTGEFDYVPGYRLKAPDGSRADLRAKGDFVLDANNKGFTVWSVEIMRKLDTGHPDEDVIFSDLSRAYLFTLAVMDDSGVVHSGSAVQRLVFQPHP